MSKETKDMIQEPNAPRNDFLTFAATSTANVIDQAAYQTLESRTGGFVSGVAKSAQLNKVWRQSSIISASIAQFIAEHANIEVIDDGDTKKIADGMGKAINAIAAGKVISVNGKDGVVVLNYADVGAAPIKDADLQGVPKAPTATTGDSSKQIANTEFVSRALNGIDGTPVGTVIFHAGDTPPKGFVACNGASLSTGTYAALYGVIKNHFGGDATNFLVPDLRGEFPRGFDAGRGKDVSRKFGTTQSDAARKLVGEVNASIQTKGGSGFTGAFFDNGHGPAGNYGGGDYSFRLGMDSSRIGADYPTALENRPTNVALLPCIKY